MPASAAAALLHQIDSGAITTLGGITVLSAQYQHYGSTGAARAAAAAAASMAATAASVAATATTAAGLPGGSAAAGTAAASVIGGTLIGDEGMAAVIQCIRASGINPQAMIISLLSSIFFLSFLFFRFDHKSLAWQLQEMIHPKSCDHLKKLFDCSYSFF